MPRILDVWFINIRKGIINLPRLSFSDVDEFTVDPGQEIISVKMWYINNYTNNLSMLNFSQWKVHNVFRCYKLYLTLPQEVYMSVGIQQQRQG